jgi:GH3 auxin-responsive promoter
VDRNPPRLLVTGRTSYFLSAFGEHVSGEEVERAVFAAAQAIGRQVAEYSVGPLTEAAQGRHLLLVEFADETPADLARFAAVVDAAFAAGNDDYRAHREGGQMLAPLVEDVKPGGFLAWMEARGKLGGQNKVPRVITDPELLASLRRFARG